ncbi:MAG: MauE/DoxX family redox-associated membrane protein [Acidobacteriota bacterium]
MSVQDLASPTDLGASQETVAESTSWRLRRALSMLGGAFLGVVLLFSTWAKAIDPAAFIEQIRTEGLDFVLPATFVAVVALALEAGLGLLLLLGVRRLWNLLPTAGLVAFFIFLTARTYWKDANGLLEEESSCGCFGKLVERTPAEAFWQDLWMLVPPLVLAALWRSAAAWPKWRAAAAIVLIAFTGGLAWKAPELPLDNLATRLAPGKLTDEICSGSDDERLCLSTIAPELQEGRHVVVMADLEDEAFGESTAALSDWALEGNPLLVLAAADPDQARAFFWQWGPAFEIREAPPSLLGALYRTLPRTFVVEDGKVVSTRNGLPEGVAASAPSEAATDPTDTPG